MSDDVEALKQRLQEAERQLRQAEGELSRARAHVMQQSKMAALGTMVAGVVHDISTPLGSIKANANLTKKLVERLAKHLPEGERRVERSLSALDDAIETSSLACDRIETIVRSLRNFVRVNDSDLVEADLQEGLTSSLQLCEHLFKNRITVQRHFAELPAVTCRPGEINQVFMNLLTNAAQAIEGRGTISVTTTTDGAQVVVAIADSGPGLTEEAKAQLFQPGFTTKEVGKGTGLGLSIVQRIVSAHGGTITAESAPGQGATFTMTLPLKPPSP